MNPPRRFVFQLTPLLDLLIILLFALFMGIRQQARTEEHQAQRRISLESPELAGAEDPLEALLAEYKWKAAAVEVLQEALEVKEEALQAALEQAQEQQADHDRLAARLKDQDELTRSLERLRKQQQQVGDLVAELFQVPDEVLKTALTPDGAPETERSPQEIEQLRSEFRKLAAQRGRQMIRHLLTFQEMRKRCDLWDVVVLEGDRFELRTGKETRPFRAGSKDEFVEALFRSYKSLEQPKDLVIMMLAWHDRSNFAAIRSAYTGLLPVAERMRSDRSGQTRFEFLVLGHQPQKKKPGS